MECVDDIIKELDILKEKIGDSRKTTVCHLVKTSSDKAPNNQSWIEYWEENVNTPQKI